MWDVSWELSATELADLGRGHLQSQHMDIAGACDAEEPLRKGREAYFRRRARQTEDGAGSQLTNSGERGRGTWRTAA